VQPRSFGEGFTARRKPARAIIVAHHSYRNIPLVRFLNPVFAILLPLLPGAAAALPEPETFRDVVAINMFKPVDGSPVAVRDLKQPCSIKGRVVMDDDDRASVVFTIESCPVARGRYTDKPVSLWARLPPSPSGYFPAGQRLRLLQFNPQ
jgi:hypothetical protein